LFDAVDVVVLAIQISLALSGWNILFEIDKIKLSTIQNTNIIKLT